jgi:hypothetical protein
MARHTNGLAKRNASSRHLSENRLVSIVERQRRRGRYDMFWKAALRCLATFRLLGLLISDAGTVSPAL